MTQQLYILKINKTINVAEFFETIQQRQQTTTEVG